MEKYKVKSFENANDVVDYFNDPQNLDKELISVCVVAPAHYDHVFYAYYKCNNNYE